MPKYFLFRAASLWSAEDDDGEDVSDEAEDADDAHEDAVHDELEGVAVGPTLLLAAPKHCQVEVVDEVDGQVGIDFCCFRVVVGHGDVTLRSTSHFALECFTSLVNLTFQKDAPSSSSVGQIASRSLTSSRCNCICQEILHFSRESLH